jgi:ketosteroid isomerase-like protein
MLSLPSWSAASVRKSSREINVARVEQRDVVRLFYDGWNCGDINFADLVAADIVNRQPEAEPETRAKPNR